MKKRFWSLLLVLVMVFTMIPATAYEASGTEQLMLRWPNMYGNDNYPMEEDEQGNVGFFNDVFTGVPGNRNPVFFHLVENNASVEQIAGGKVTSSDTSVIKVSQNAQNPNATDIEVVSFGNATINYTSAAGKTYSMNVNVILPDVGMYSAPVANQANYISKFEVTDSADTFYIMPSEHYTLTSITPSAMLDEIADITFDANKNYATVKVTGTPNPNQFYQVCVDATHNDGDFDIQGRYYNVSLVNNKTTLSYCYPDYSNNGPQFPATPYWQTSIYTCPGRMDNLYISLLKGGVAGNSITNISTSDPHVVNVYTEAGSDFVRIEAVGIGNANLIYTDENNNTYTIPVTVDLPQVGAYTSKTPSANSLIQNRFEVNAIGDEFYLIARNGLTFDKVDLCNGLGDIATVALDSTKTIATIKIVKAPVAGMGYFIEHRATNQYGGWDQGQLWIDIVNNMPHLEFVYVDDYGTNVFDGFDFVTPGGQTEGWINFADANGASVISVEDLKSTNENVVKISSANDPQNPDKVLLDFTGWGTAQIVYTDANGTEYTMDVVADFDNLCEGFFTDTTFTKDNWIGIDYTVTNDTNVIYFLTRYDFTMSDFELLDDAKNYATFKMISNQCVEITISDKIKDYVSYGDIGDFSVFFAESDSTGQAWPMGFGMNLTNKICEHAKTKLVGTVLSGCTTDGYTGDAVCELCNTVVAKGSVIPATGHSYKDGKCDVCGDKPVVAEKVESVDTTKPVEEVTPVVEQATADVATKEVTAIVDAILADNVTDEVKAAVSEETITEIKKELAAGKEITTEVVAKPVEEKDVDKNVIKEIKKELGNAGNVAQFLDLSILIKSVAADGTEKELGTLNELGEKVKFTIVVPEELVKEGREFYVIRVHEGKAEILELTKNEDGTYSFETDRFSTYALAYDEVSESASEDAPKTEAAPKTGDENNVLGYMMLLAVAFVAFALAKKKEVQ